MPPGSDDPTPSTTSRIRPWGAPRSLPVRLGGGTLSGSPVSVSPSSGAPSPRLSYPVCLLSCGPSLSLFLCLSLFLPLCVSPSGFLFVGRPPSGPLAVCLHLLFPCRLLRRFPPVPSSCRVPRRLSGETRAARDSPKEAPAPFHHPLARGASGTPGINRPNPALDAPGPSGPVSCFPGRNRRVCRPSAPVARPRGSSPAPLRADLLPRRHVDLPRPPPAGTRTLRSLRRRGEVPRLNPGDRLSSLPLLLVFGSYLRSLPLCGFPVLRPGKNDHYHGHCTCCK